jgi:hypothetical protein
LSLILLTPVPRVGLFARNVAEVVSSVWYSTCLVPSSLFVKKQRCAYAEFTWNIVLATEMRRGWWEECTWRTLPNSPFARRLPAWILHVLYLKF